MNKQKGGAIEETSKVPVKNSPFVPNQRKEIDRQRYTPPIPKPEVKPMVDLKVYNPGPPPKPKGPLPVYNSPFPYHIPVGGPYYPMQELLQPLMYPVVNTYNISTDGPNTDFSKINMVFEDVLPLKDLVDTYLTVQERLNMARFVRAVLVKQGDGEMMSLNGKDKGSLLSYLKFMEVNPYHHDPHFNNTLKTLPNNMLLYRSGYPVKYSPEHGTVICADPSIGINIRIYRMSVAEFEIKDSITNDYHKFDLWREIAYYEEIREKVIKKKLCPNFVMMYAYYLNDNKTINFDKINALKGNMLKKNDPNYISCLFEPNYLATSEEIKDPFTGAIVKTVEKNIHADSHKCLIALTESPTHTILGWASKIYLRDHNIRRMINHGLHNDNVWLSIIFQLLVAMYVLQKLGIGIRDMKLQDNVFIKDLKIGANTLGWWKYRIGGLEYFVPNYGYLLQVDTNFKDIPAPESSLLPDSKIKQWKIYSNIFQGAQPFNEQDLNTLIHTNFCNLVNPSTFGREFTNMAGVGPSDNIKSLLEKIYNDAISSGPNIKFSDYIYKHVRQFLNNRIGTRLLKSEIEFMVLYGVKDFKKGDLVVHESNYDTYTWVMFLKQEEYTDPDIGKTIKATVLTKKTPETDDIFELNVSLDALYSYNKGVKPEPLVKPLEPKYNEEPLETYIIFD